jgi:hypothetical protein
VRDIWPIWIHTISRRLNCGLRIQSQGNDYVQAKGDVYDLLIVNGMGLDFLDAKQSLLLNIIFQNGFLKQRNVIPHR